jgi:arsenite methyltransferase
MTALQQTADLFDDWARGGHAERMERGHSARAVHALEAMGIQPFQRCLDLGCGNGWATRWMKDKVGKEGFAAGVDAAPEMIELAKAASPDYGLQFRVCAFEDLPWRNYFDHAFSMEALYYAADLGAALQRVVRALKPGGALTVCTDFYVENPQSHGWPGMMGVPMTLLSEKQWGQALVDAGLELEASFRCYDERPIDPTLDAAKAEELRVFRTEIGALALRGRKPEF